MQATDEQRQNAALLASEPAAHAMSAEGAYLDAVERVQMPGEFGEYARAPAGWATIERRGGPVEVFVVHWSDARELNADEITELAFDLLVLKDIALAAAEGPADA